MIAELLNPCLGLIDRVISTNTFQFNKSEALLLDILIIAHRVPFPPNKGEKIRTFHQLTHLLDNGHTLLVCVPITEINDVNHLINLTNKYDIESSHTILKTKALRLIQGIIKNAPLSVANFYSKKLQTNIDKILTTRNIDAIICTSSSMAEYIFKSTGFNQLLKKPKLLMDFMDIDSDKWRQYAKTAKLPLRWVYLREARLLSKYEKRIQNKFDACFLISEAEVQLFTRVHNSNKNVHILGNGIDTGFFTPPATPPENKHPVFLFTGVMDYKPNIDAVIWFVDHAWQNIIDLYPDARFIIAGMNPTSKILLLANRTGVEITGFVDDILPFYHQSDFFVAPLRIARGVQNKVLQAFACGLPVISTSMGAEGIDCTDRIDIHLADSAEEFLQGIKHLINDTQYKNSIRDKAIKLVRNQYSWKGKLKKLDQQLTGNNRSD